MRLFAIDADNTITAFPSAEQVPAGQEQFATEKELAKLAANWPADRLVQVWNSFAGVAGFGADLKPVKKFTDRKTAIKRIWTAIQKLDGAAEAEAPSEASAAASEASAPETTAAPKTAKGAHRAAKGAPKKTKATKTTTTAVPREFSKKAVVIELLRRKGGATLAEIAKATDWQNHSIRGFISGMLSKKMGLTVESTKNEQGERTYKIAR
jgi:Protein of unknown function (DUF3489)